jgi:putative transposase
MSKSKLSQVPEPILDPADASVEELAKALIATPQAQAMITQSGARSFNDLVGRDGLVSRMLRPLMQEMLNAEMTDHLGYPKHHPAGYLSGNSRNGVYQRTLRSTDGTLNLDIPRDRAGTFESGILPPYKQISAELEEKIIALYAYGNSTQDIVEFIAETYHGLEVSEGFVSQVTLSQPPYAKQVNKGLL